MKVCPYRIVSVLDGVSRTCPADGSVSACCTALRNTSLSTQVLYPNDNAYHHSLGSYWRTDIQELYPACIVQPRSAQDVSLTLSTLVDSNDDSPQCQFAVRSGGHSTVLDSTNADYAVTIDLSMLNRTVYHPESSTASVQPGARWKSVYKALGEHGVAVPGGRGGTVGVGGFITGGGNSFHSAQYGLTCDSVVDFEIVLPSGQITTASPTKNPDLFQALKGGSGNFGIVTSFTLQAFSQPPASIWGGVVAYDHASTVSAQIDAQVRFTNNIRNDPSASLIPIYNYNSQLGVPVIANSLVYTKPEAYPDAFRDFYNMRNISDSMRFTDLEDLTGELEPEAGLQKFFTLSFANNPAILHKAVAIQDRMIEEAKSSARSENWSIISMYQPLPGLFAEIGRKKGGNVLGLDEKGNYILDLLWFIWDDAEDTPLFDWIGKTFVDELDGFARSVGGDSPFVYLNYAAESQDPLRGYGEENLAFLKAVAEKYDPLGVFQTQVPGGFKVSRA
ncbi:hypothetical protein ASPVEDRAFT_37046 [Aspergillus versicolor CBS 583.65]|uniref:FAD-binding PCMH-type domain-containing protein n=1 Tax=Aspergillus versicolor CBS 583.65 TaxID=1036611 RepID=A0A1L9P7X0_ASPVE|nr:uncharacterized protein ASPVEDRAFT_37046 [Aspergillus versicolor CBS 583.65]OJI97629.1 hypothetical protein ASPVEDRAFT_37046 [Aspergillus versicolor CBS 583.65]